MTTFVTARYSEAEKLRAAADGERITSRRRGLSALLGAVADAVEAGDPRMADVDADDVLADLDQLVRRGGESW